MKKRTFLFSTLFMCLFVLIFATSCSSNQETDNQTSEANTSNEATNNELSSEIDYSETDEVEAETSDEELTAEADEETTEEEVAEKETVSEKTVASSSREQQETAPTARKTTTTKPVVKSVEKAEKVETVSKKPVVASKKAEVAPKKVEKPAKAFSHDDWNALLQKYVSSTGKVNYAGFKKDKAKLDAYLKLLSANEPSGKSRNDQMAYWINAYNAFTVDLIADNYPVSSILKLDNGKTWMVKRITIGGKKYSLEDIEKKVLI